MARPTKRRLTWVIDQRRLMAESEGVIATVRRRGSEHQRLIAHRLTETPRRYHEWESRHAGLMAQVAAAASVRGQVHGLRRIMLTSVHVSALARYLKAHRVVGEERRLLVGMLHAYSDYTRAILQEHAAYIRAESTSICSRYLALKLGDDRLKSWLADYYRLYDDYFAMFCQSVLAEARGESFALQPLLGEKKAQVHARRAEVLSLTDVELQDADLGSLTGRFARPRFPPSG